MPYLGKKKNSPIFGSPTWNNDNDNDNNNDNDSDNA